MVVHEPMAIAHTQGNKVLTGKRIFLIDDEAGNIAILSSVLRRQGASVDYEQWGTETANKLHHFMPVDLILLDLMLRNTSGYTVFSAVRAMPEFVHIPIVVISALNPDTEVIKARQKGFNGFIAKPIHPLTFGKHLLTVINGGEVWNPLD